MKKECLTSRNKIHFTSLGCARNWVDSEVMIGLLLKNGFEIIPQLEKADFLIVNTCGFLEAARKEALETIEEIFQYKKKPAKVIITGCMVQKHAEILKSAFPQIHYMLGSGDVEKILEAVSEKKGSNITDAKSFLEWGQIPRFIATPKHFAYLKIAEGCKKRCAFCIIPTIKGKLQSKSVEQILREFRILLSQGVYEIILIAQDLGDFGKDRKEKGGLCSLLKMLLEEKSDFWLRLLYLYPDEITEELIDIVQSDKRICHYVDMPIQHIDDKILKSMFRKTNQKQIYQIIDKLREKIPDIVIRTSLMVGFPGETKEQFEKLIDFVKVYQLDHIGVFAYSNEQLAYASNYVNQVVENEKNRRRKRLMQEQQKVVQLKHRKKVGEKLDVIVEGFHPDSSYLLRGRYYGQSPETDGQIIINDGRIVDNFGKKYLVEITDTAGYDLVGKVTQPLSNPSSSVLRVIQS